MHHDVTILPTSAGTPTPHRRRPDVGARCRDVVIGAGMALTGFVLIWAKPDWLSVAGACLSTVGTLRLLVIAIRLAANTPGGVTVPGHTRRV